VRAIFAAGAAGGGGFPSKDGPKEGAFGPGEGKRLSGGSIPTRANAARLTINRPENMKKRVLSLAQRRGSWGKRRFLDIKRYRKIRAASRNRVPQVSKPNIISVSILLALSVLLRHANMYGSGWQVSKSL
jgi:hypothetical protein